MTAVPFELPDHAATVNGQTLLTYPHRKLHVLVATTGSVASIKLWHIVEELLKYRGICLQIVSTAASLHFIDQSRIEEFASRNVRLWRDEDEWNSWKSVADPILHIELRRWADIVLIAPCSANTLGKIANGLADNLLTSLLRALNPVDTTVYICPAMNTQMYYHPMTAKHLKVVQDELGYQVLGPISKGLACGDDGMGAMMEWKDIVQVVVDKDQLQLEDSDGVVEQKNAVVDALL